MVVAETGLATRSELEARALNLDTRVFMMLTAGPDDPMLSLELSMPQLKLLVLVERQGRPSMGALAHYLGVGQPAISGLVDRLTEHGLVRREDDPSDRRIVRVQGTAAGLELVQRIRLSSRSRLQRVIARLTDEELLQVVSALEIMHRAATDEVADQGMKADSAVGARR